MKLKFRLSILAAAIAALPAQAAVVQSVQQEFDQLGRLAKVTQPDGTWISYGYDPNGNRTEANDQLGRTTRYQYDAFNRLISRTDPQGGITKLNYDLNNNLVKVTDPRGLTTEYQYNGFDELVKQISPDTGTDTQTFGSEGQLSSQTNAVGQVTQFKYDATGRLIEQRHAGGTNWIFLRDNLGRLVEVKDAAGTTHYSYDSQSRLQSKTQLNGTLTQTVGYRWTPTDQVAGITTPSGKVIDYIRHEGRIVAIHLDGQPLLKQVAYHPLGMVQGWTWTNGLHHTRLYDTNGRLYRFESAGIIAKRLLFDGASNIQKLEDLQDTTETQSFGYNQLDQLTSETVTNKKDTYLYDGNGNRTSATYNGTQTASQIDTSSNRLIAYGNQARTYTATGHIQSDGTRTFEYDGAERLIKIKTNGQTYQYQYNAWGERLAKTGVRFVYDEQNRLLGEYEANGRLIQETIWLDNLPIATIRPDPANTNQSQVYYVHPDHLGSPRAVSDPTINKAVWRWDSDAFGKGNANQDPDRDGKKFIYNLRFPGQYYDQETGLHYNFFRDYDSTAGRYVQSDPIGLRGGINTYAYSENNPAKLSDPYGLKPLSLFEGLDSGPALPVYTVDPVKPRAPDFINFQFDAYVVSIWGTFSRDGRSFIGGGINNPLAGDKMGLAGSTSAGWLLRKCVNPGDTNNFLAGFAGMKSGAYYGVGGGVAYSPGLGAAVMVGVGAGATLSKTSSPVSVGAGYTIPVGETGITW